MKNETFTVDALVLAGGDGSVIDPNSPVKSMVPIAGKPMVQWVLEALKQSKHIDRIAVVLPHDVDDSAFEHIPDFIVLSDGQISENIIEGRNALQSEGLILSVTSDVPSITPEAIDAFIEATVQRGVALSYPLIPEESMVEEYPNSERTFFKLVEGRVTGGNAMILDAQYFDELRDLGQQVFETRKNPLKMAGLIGARFALKLATGKLAAKDIEEKIQDLIGFECAAIILPYASIGADVDKPSDIAVVETKLQHRQRGSS